ELRIVHRHDATEQVRVSANELRYGLNRRVGAELERALVQRRGEGIVHGDNRAGLSRGGADRCKVSDVEQWIRWGFQPDQIGVRTRADPRGRVRDSDSPHGPAALRLSAGGEAGDALIAVSGEGDDRSG